MVTVQPTSAHAEALFVSRLQCSDDPTPRELSDAVMTSLRRYGARGCAEQMAQEFGEHPVEAASRMSWVLEKLRLALVASTPTPPTEWVQFGLAA